MAVKYGRRVKELMVKEIEDLFTSEKGLVVSSFQNIKATEMDVFRKRISKAGTEYRIIRKRLGRMALENAGLSELTGIFEERKNIGVALIKDDPVVIAKILVGFARENKNFRVAVGYLEGRLLEAGNVKELAALPGREQLLAMVVGTMNAPVTGFVGVLASVLRSLCYALNAVKGKK